MAILIFVIILAILILVHEFGHFLVAKLFKIRVDEFGIGYPPRALTFFEWRGTRFTLNWIPFGGFVKIFGENGVTPEMTDPMEAQKSFTEKPRYAQALVLVAGVIFNVVFAWMLITAGYMIGLPTSTSNVPAGAQVEDTRLVITTVMPESPAALAGLKAGDTISAVSTAPSATASTSVLPVESLSPDTVSNFIQVHDDEIIAISYTRGAETGVADVTPVDGIIEGRKAIGISMDTVGRLSLSFGQAIVEGTKTTYALTVEITKGLSKFIYNTVRGNSDFSQVTGPVGIVGLVGDASRLGFIYLLSFTAFISINLAVINLIPFPALDGGRLLFVLIEAIKRSPISPKVSNILNTIGFLLLLTLMVLVTIQDVWRLF